METISYAKYCQLPKDELAKLLKKYRLFWSPKNPGVYKLVERKKQETK